MAANLILTLLLVIGLMSYAGCDRDGPAEQAGEKIDRAVDDAQDRVEEAGDEIEDATDDAANR